MYVSLNFRAATGPITDDTDSQEIQDKFREDTEYYLRYCKAVESELNVRFRLILNGTPEAIAAKEVSMEAHIRDCSLIPRPKFSIKEMTHKLAGRKDLVEKLIPKDFTVGCRRPTPGNGIDSPQRVNRALSNLVRTGFLEALTHNKTTTLFGEINEVTSTGFVDGDGVHHEVDVIICATGWVKPASSKALPS